ncbi:DUF3530 family protein [Simiduia agarivorans]|nr:DUF3530 family protein [Simiduia agarivorans]
MIRLSVVLWLFAASVSAQAPVSDPATEAAAETEPAVEPAAPAPEPAPYRNREHRDMSLLAQSLPDDQVLWVNGQEGEVLALYIPAISAEPVGAVLLVQDQDLHSQWPQRLDGLRRYLPEFGWSTLLVSLPLPDPLPIPARPAEPVAPVTGGDSTEAESGDAQDAGADEARPETEEVFDDSAGDVADVADMQQEPAAPEPPPEPVIPAARLADERLAQAVDALHDRGQFNIVLLAEGAGAVRAARLAEAMKYDGFRALVLLDARNRLAGETGDVLAMMRESNVPVLDVWANAHQADPIESQARNHSARRAGLEIYQPLTLPAYEPGQQRLYKRVRGFMEKHARGVKVDNAEVVRSP